MSTYADNFIKKILHNSFNSDSWESAVQEWNITDVIEDDNMLSSCICGKEHLRYLYTITNILNGKILYPIGSKCIKKFERPDLNEHISITEQLFKLKHSVSANESITLSNAFFSRKLLKYLFEMNVFIPNQYNSFDTYCYIRPLNNSKDRQTTMKILCDTVLDFSQVGSAKPEVVAALRQGLCRTKMAGI